jgi:hypothetical protein
MKLRVGASRPGAWLVVLAMAAGPRVALAQGTATAPAVTVADYQRAEKMLAAAVNPLIVGGTVNATWLADDRFTYRSTIADGFEFLLVDPVAKTKVRAFDHERLAAALGVASKSTIDAKKLPFTSIELSEDGASVSTTPASATPATSRAPPAPVRTTRAIPTQLSPLTARARSSSRTGTSGCATWPRRSSVR